MTYRSGETAQFTINVVNQSDAAVAGTIQLGVVSDLDTKLPIARRTLELSAHDSVAWTIQWKVPSNIAWGASAYAQLLNQNETVQADAQAFFAVGTPWKVGHWSSLSSMGDLPPAEIKRQIMGMAHRWHVGAFDYFSWQPSGWETMAPKETKWHTGQNVSPESKAALQEMIRQAHASGIQVYSYLQGSTWGLAGLEWLRQHPELWNFDAQGRAFPSRFIFNGETLDRLRDGEARGKNRRAVWVGSGIIWDKSVRDYLYDQLRQSVEMFDWDGFRSDGLPYPGNAHDMHGKFHQGIEKDLIASQIEFINELRQKLQEIDPDCELHFNAGAVSYHAGRQPLSLFNAKATDSMALWESGHYVERGKFDLRDFDVYVDYLHKEVQAAREVGGYRSVGYCSTTSKLLEAATTACGAKWSASRSRGAKHYENGPDPWRSFTFRYSRYFWDAAIRRVTDATDHLTVTTASNDVRWEDFVHRRHEADGREFLIVHLLNLAVPYTAGQIDPKTPATHDLRITLSGNDAQRVKRAVALTCDQGVSNMSSELKVITTQTDVTALLPTLKTWSVVVFELEAQ